MRVGQLHTLLLLEIDHANMMLRVAQDLIDYHFMLRDSAGSQ